jgi:hypothetical protein
MDAVEAAIRRVVDVAADHAIDLAAPGLGGDRLLESADE